MVAEDVVGQRWEMRLKTHRYMLTRFRVVSQSESPSSDVVRMLMERWHATGSVLMRSVRFALKTNFSSLSTSYSASLMLRVFFREDPPKTDLRSFELSLRPASDR